jgi:hypothetical protein
MKYFYDPSWQPARLQRLYQAISPELDSFQELEFGFANRETTTHGCPVGLDIFLEVIVNTNLELTSINFPAPMNNPYWFLTLTSFNKIKSLCNKVESLCLRSSYQVNMDRGGSIVVQIPITTTLFPNLKSLLLDGRENYDELSSATAFPFPESTAVPHLTHLKFIRAYQTDANLLAFVELFHGSLKSITLRSMVDLSYEPIFTLL